LQRITGGGKAIQAQATREQRQQINEMIMKLLPHLDR